MIDRRNRLRFGVALVATCAVLVAGCGGGDDGGDTAPSTAAATTVPAAGPGDTEPPATEVPSTEVPATDAPPTTLSAEPWTDTAADELAAVQAAQAGTGDATDVLTRLFGQPTELPWPDDAAVTDVWVTAEAGDDGTSWVEWRLTVATAMTPVDLETLVVEAFADSRWEPGARVESTLDSGVFVTLNYPATAEGVAEGFGTAAITVGPETDFGAQTGRNQMEFSVEQDVASIYANGLPWFFVGWLAEMPVADGLELTYLDATTVDTGVWLSASYSAPADQFETLVAFYAQDHTEGALELDASTPPDDLSTLDYFTAGFFPTLAGYTIFVTVERNLSDPLADAVVRLSVRVEG